MSVTLHQHPNFDALYLEIPKPKQSYLLGGECVQNSRSHTSPRGFCTHTPFKNYLPIHLNTSCFGREAQRNTLLFLNHRKNIPLLILILGTELQLKTENKLSNFFQTLFYKDICTVLNYYMSNMIIGCIFFFFSRGCHYVVTVLRTNVKNKSSTTNITTIGS